MEQWERKRLAKAQRLTDAVGTPETTHGDAVWHEDLMPEPGSRLPDNLMGRKSGPTWMSMRMMSW